MLNKFLKAGFNNFTEDTDDIQIETNIDTNAAWNLLCQKNKAISNISYNEYVNVDNDLQTVCTLTDEQIVSQINQNNDIITEPIDDDVASDDENDIEYNIPSRSEVFKCFATIRLYCQSKQDQSEELLAKIEEIESEIENTELVQSKICNFFKKL